jgi:hypothetical protein
MLPRRLPKKQNRTDRWKSQAHCSWLRGFACAACDSDVCIEVSHIRIGTDGATGRKPSDFYALPLCKSCHQTLHQKGERSFYAANNMDAIALADEFARASPKSREIAQVRKERGEI